MQTGDAAPFSLPTRLFWTALGTLSVAFHIWLIFSGLVPNLVSRPLHMALALPWVFVFLAKSTTARLTGVVFAIVGILGCLYIVRNEEMLGEQYGSLEGEFQLWLAGALIVTVLEMARRAIGWPLPVIAAIALLYGLLGDHLPGEFGHPGLPVESFLGTIVVAEGGLWGSLTGVSVNIVAVFVIMGAVLSSALFGSISGSASANVASTGAITLPTMRRLGYPRSLAGAVEAVASSGGQIMPPLMGAGAFVMVELTGIPYTQIMAAALLPAVLYFLTVWIGINAFAQRHDLRPIAPEDRPAGRVVAVTAAFFLVPFVVLLERMFIGRFSRAPRC